jgi:hypothetical protein
MIKKRILKPKRLRAVPDEGFSWMDRRFFRLYSRLLSSEAILLYCFLVSVSDKHGLSFYGSASTSGLLHLDERLVVQAREELIQHDLIAYERPLTQVLSLPALQGRCKGVQSIAEIFGEMDTSGRSR